jgi:EAL domain-containing protein (putative c-di-GMP-specific phosphodiesterase class I)
MFPILEWQRPAAFDRLNQTRTNLAHYGAMRTANKAVRQSVSLPANVAAQVRRLAKAQRLSANRMLLELIENGMEAEKRKQQEFLDLAERFRNATDPKEVQRLGEQMGRMVFGA